MRLLLRFAISRGGFGNELLFLVPLPVRPVGDTDKALPFISEVVVVALVALPAGVHVVSLDHVTTTSTAGPATTPPTSLPARLPWGPLPRHAPSAPPLTPRVEDTTLAALPGGPGVLSIWDRYRTCGDALPASPPVARPAASPIRGDGHAATGPILGAIDAVVAVISAPEGGAELPPSLALPGPPVMAVAAAGFAGGNYVAAGARPGLAVVVIVDDVVG